ncbi:excalibur calcium-binding domain-containing protein [Zhongshania arctica]|uniref:Excalibur calcium-binding domain-containing protein n=1 Tax=Zhongshania arctica TaxID=3238302 RepID=A0ABV3TRW0_9GAMM
MRVHGNLIKWNDDRGFGFVSSPQNAGEIFVHISAFPRDGIRPKIGELISFEVEIEKNGKKRAVHVLRPGSTVRKRKGASHRSKGDAVALKLGITFVLVLALGYFGFNFYISQQSSELLMLKQAITAPMSASRKFECDGRKHCSQMTSRAEAEYFIKNCPNTKMDGDHDGTPCENDSRF